MAFWKHVVKGIASVLSVSASPLYRYPYRNAAEAFRGDTHRLSDDMNAVMEQFDDKRPR